MNSTTTIRQCDACHVAQGRVRVSKGNDDLVFCRHHYQKFELTLLAEEWVVVGDTRAELVPA